MTTIFILLLIKHTICDLFLQSTRPPADKSKILGYGLHRHCLDHAVATAIILLFFIEIQYALLFGLLDYIAHCTIDWLKHKILKKYNVVKNGKMFWGLQSIDQSLHYITYFIIVIMIGHI
jgi:hypothetical protein